MAGAVGKLDAVFSEVLTEAKPVEVVLVPTESPCLEGHAANRVKLLQ